MFNVVVQQSIGRQRLWAGFVDLDALVQRIVRFEPNETLPHVDEVVFDSTEIHTGWV